MNKAENYKNWGLEELMNYINSLTEIQTHASYEDSPSKITLSRDKNYKNWALEELMNYVNLRTEIQTNASNDNLLNQIIPVQSNLVEVTDISRATEQKTDCCLPSALQVGEKEEIALSPSNLANLMALIQDLRLSKFNLVKRINYLSQAITEFHQDLETYKVQFHAASSKLRKQNQELEASHQNIQAQHSAIEKLTKQLAASQKLVAQVQAEYQEQSYQLSAEKDACRDLRTRLNREQQHSLQLKVALEKCLEVPAASSPLADDYEGTKANNLEDSTSFAAKALPIKPWTTQTIYAGNKIDLSWERQNPQAQSNAEVEETKDLQPITFTTECVEPASNLRTEDDIDERQKTSPIEINCPKPPSPVVYPSRPPKGRKTLAAIELPSFIS